MSMLFCTWRVAPYTWSTNCVVPMVPAESLMKNHVSAQYSGTGDGSTDRPGVGVAGYTALANRKLPVKLIGPWSCGYSRVKSVMMPPVPAHASAVASSNHSVVQESNTSCDVAEGAAVM